MRPFSSRSSSPSHQVRVNGKIRAREVRVIGADGHQLGVLSLADAINLARSKGVDLVEIAATATPPVCRLVDYGKYRYEQSKKEKEARKHQHATKVKEIQLSPQIDPHDFAVKLSHAIDFLCQEMKVKVTLKFRGREMAHQEFGFQQIAKFTREVAPYGHPDFEAKRVGKGITMMFSPLPRAKRARNPRENEHGIVPPSPYPHDGEQEPAKPSAAPKAKPGVAVKPAPPAFSNNPFAKLDIGVRPETPENPAAES
jgi:translation initiation factor IF-3